MQSILSDSNGQAMADMLSFKTNDTYNKSIIHEYQYGCYDHFQVKTIYSYGKIECFGHLGESYTWVDFLKFNLRQN